MRNLLVLVSILFAFSANASVGGVDGAGGKSVVCRDAQLNITSAELLDLYEGRELYGVAFKSNTDTVDNQIKSALARLGGRGADFSDLLAKFANLVQTTKRMVHDGASLSPVDDDQSPIIPKKGCAIEQLANYISDVKILVNDEIFSRLDNSNQAAFVVHEALYRMARVYGAKNSVLVRLDVAQVFAGNSTQDIKAGLPDKYYECATMANSDGSYFPGSHFYAYNSDGELWLQFDYLEGNLMVSNLTVGMDNIPVDQLLNSEKMTYYLSLIDPFNSGINLALDFQTVDGDKGPERHMKIGNVNQPNLPQHEFICFPAPR